MSRWGQTINALEVSGGSRRHKRFYSFPLTAVFVKTKMMRVCVRVSALFSTCVVKGAWFLRSIHFLWEEVVHSAPTCYRVTLPRGQHGSPLL